MYLRNGESCPDHLMIFIKKAGKREEKKEDEALCYTRRQPSCWETFPTQRLIFSRSRRKKKKEKKQKQKQKGALIRDAFCCHLEPLVGALEFYERPCFWLLKTGKEGMELVWPPRACWRCAHCQTDRPSFTLFSPPQGHPSPLYWSPASFSS